MKKYSFIIVFLFLINFNLIEAVDSFKITVKTSDTKASVTTSCIICTFEDSKYNGTVSISDSVSGGYFQMKSVFFDKTKPVTNEFTGLKKDVIYKVFVSANGVPSTTTTFKINTPKPVTNPTVIKTELEKIQETYNEAKIEYEKNPTAKNLEYLNTATKNLEEAKKKSGVGNDKPTELNKKEEVKESDRSTYKLLAPLPGLPSVKTDRIGDYFNIIFNIAIGICGVLAVIMLIIHGISYMTSESFTEKAELKKKIWGPIGGLLLALGAYAILNTIDPALTGKDGLTVDQVEADIDGDPILSNEKTIIPSTGAKTSKCPEGVEEVKTVTVRFIACKSISQRFKQMIADANAAGLKISGGGFRTPAEQIATRRANCGAGNEFNKNAKCNPTTAYPGTSMHETGLAFDLKCNGSLINIGTGKKNRFPIVASTRVCFDWLSKNAGKYGLRNLPIENWHWSTNGH